MQEGGFDRGSSAGFLANHMARLFAQGLQRRIAPLGLAPAQFMTLLELWGKDGLTQAELVRRLDVEQATMANTLARMERDGLIERRAVTGDRRARAVHLTARAQELRGPATEAAAAQNAAALGGLSEEEQAAFVALSHRIIINMQGSRGMNAPGGGGSGGGGASP